MRLTKTIVTETTFFGVPIKVSGQKAYALVPYAGPGSWSQQYKYLLRGKRVRRKSLQVRAGDLVYVWEVFVRLPGDGAAESVHQKLGFMTIESVSQVAEGVIALILYNAGAAPNV